MEVHCVKDIISNELYSKLRFREKLLMIILKKYTYDIYKKGIIKGFEWNQ